MKVNIPHNAVVALNLSQCADAKKALSLMGRHTLTDNMAFSRVLSYGEALDCRDRWCWILGDRKSLRVLLVDVMVDTTSTPLDWTGIDGDGTPIE